MARGKCIPSAYTSSARHSRLACPAPCSAAAVRGGQQLFAIPCWAAIRGIGINDVGFGKLDYQFERDEPCQRVFQFGRFPRRPTPTTPATTVEQQLDHRKRDGRDATSAFFVANWDSTIHPTMINNFRFQWSQDLEIIGANGTGPSVSIANVMAYGMPNALPRPAFPDEHRMQFADVLSKTSGKHTFKAGLDINVIHEVLINLFQGGGVYSYNGAAATAFDNWAADV